MSDDEHWQIDEAIAEESDEDSDGSAIDIDTMDVDELENEDDDDKNDKSFSPGQAESSEEISSEESGVDENEDDDEKNKNVVKKNINTKTPSKKPVEEEEEEEEEDSSDSDQSEINEPTKVKVLKKPRARTASECIDREVFKYPGAPADASNHASIGPSPDVPISIWNWKKKQLEPVVNGAILRDGITIQPHKPKSEKKTFLPKVQLPDGFDASDTTWIVACDKSVDPWKLSFVCAVKIEGLDGYYPLKDLQELSLLRPILKKSGVKGLSLASIVEIQNDPALCPGKVASLFTLAEVPANLQKSNKSKNVLLCVSSVLENYSIVTTAKRKEVAAAKKKQKKSEAQEAPPSVLTKISKPKPEEPVASKQKSKKRPANDDNDVQIVTKKERILPKLISSPVQAPMTLPKPTEATSSVPAPASSTKSIKVTSLLPAVEKKLDKEMRGEGVIKITASFSSLSQASAFIETARIHGVYTESA